jgi:hypothetical protein
MDILPQSFAESDGNHMISDASSTFEDYFPYGHAYYGRNHF